MRDILDNLRHTWQDQTPRRRAIAVGSGIVALLCLIWIVVYLSGDEAVVIQAEPTPEMSAAQADIASLRAMPMDLLESEVARREEAFRRATPESYDAAMEALGRARDVLSERRSASGG
jgi:hypothetical protein